MSIYYSSSKLFKWNIVLSQVINKMIWLWLISELTLWLQIFKPCTVTLGSWLEASTKLHSVLLKYSHVLHALPRGDANFHLIKVYDVSWDTKPDKLIHKSITYYHKLLSERRLQLDPRQSMLWCSSSHSNIGDISIVTGFSFCLICRFPSSHQWPA